MGKTLEFYLYTDPVPILMVFEYENYCLET